MLFVKCRLLKLVYISYMLYFCISSEFPVSGTCVHTSIRNIWSELWEAKQAMFLRWFVRECLWAGVATWIREPCRLESWSSFGIALFLLSSALNSNQLLPGRFGHGTELILSAFLVEWQSFSVAKCTFATGCQHVTIIGLILTSKGLHLKQIKSPECMLDEAYPSVQMFKISANESSAVCSKTRHVWVGACLLLSAKAIWNPKLEGLIDRRETCNWSTLSRQGKYWARANISSQGHMFVGPFSFAIIANSRFVGIGTRGSCLSSTKVLLHGWFWSAATIVSGGRQLDTPVGAVGTAVID